MASGSVAVPQKRVLPSRSRRGGPGVGNCDSDILILETSKRQMENEPLIPKNTRVFLTTNPALAPPETSVSSQKINSRGYDRYFERPEVIKAYHEQVIIETPEFWSTADGEGESAVVMSRFRPRIDETQVVDTSDEAYLQRHRKYEKFEKRQRLREKEKLQHEKYKLHERVEQLRVMDYSAFLTLPGSAFSSPSINDESPDGSSSHISNGTAIAEGERRRKEMLTVAEALEGRYKTLLPPRPWRKPAAGSAEGEHDSDPPAVSFKQFPQADEGESEAEDKEDEEQQPSLKQQQPSLKVKLNLTKSQSDPSTKRGRPKKDKKNSKDQPDPFSPEPSQLSDTPRVISSLPTSAPSPMYPEIAVLSFPDSDQAIPDDTVDSSELVYHPRPKTYRSIGRKRGNPMKSKLHADISTETPNDGDVDELASPSPELSQILHPPPKKRRKTVTVDDSTVTIDRESVSVPPSVDKAAASVESISAPVGHRNSSRALSTRSAKTCCLVDAAQKNKSGRRPRHNLAWGCKVPAEVTDLEMDFELPLWLLLDDTFQLRYSHYFDFQEDPRYQQQINPLFKLDSRFVNGVRMATPENEKLAMALDSAHREHGEDSQSESEDEENGGEEESQEKEKGTEADREEELEADKDTMQLDKEEHEEAKVDLESEDE